MTLMCSEVFRVLATNPELRSIHLGYIRDSWIDDLGIKAAGPQSFFQSMTVLSCKISSTGLQQLLSCMPGLVHLEVVAEERSTDMMDVIVKAGLTHLSVVIIRPCVGLTISARQLLSLARSNPKLHTLEIPQNPENNDNTLPIVDDIDDGIFEQIAKSLPRLMEFCLRFPAHGLTEKSVLSLGQHCPELTKCYLTADTHYARLLEGTQPGMWSKLTSLQLNRAVDRDDDEAVDLTDTLTGGRPDEIARQLTDLMPALKSAAFRPDRRFDELVFRIMYSERDRGEADD